MDDPPIDEVDRRILRLLDEDARNNTNAEISERAGVSSSTVGNRIAALEEQGILKGYHPEIDYEALEMPLRVLFICSAPITDRRALVRQAIDLPSVVSVRELMTGESNLHIEVVGTSNEDITEIAREIDQLGLNVNEEVLIKREVNRASNVVR